MTYGDDPVIRTRTEETQVGGPPAGGYVQPGYAQPGYAPAGHATVRESSTVIGGRGDRSHLLERFVDLIFGIILALITLRIVLLLVAARESNSLVAAIYGITEVFVAPFRGIVGVDELDAGRSELDVSAIVAFVGWALIWLLIRSILRLFRPRGTYA